MSCLSIVGKYHLHGHIVGVCDMNETGSFAMLFRSSERTKHDDNFFMNTIKEKIDQIHSTPVMRKWVNDYKNRYPGEYYKPRESYVVCDLSNVEFYIDQDYQESLTNASRLQTEQINFIFCDFTKLIYDDFTVEFYYQARYVVPTADIIEKMTHIVDQQQKRVNYGNHLLNEIRSIC